MYPLWCTRVTITEWLNGEHQQFHLHSVACLILAFSIVSCTLSRPISLPLSLSFSLRPPQIFLSSPLSSSRVSTSPSSSASSDTGFLGCLADSWWLSTVVRCTLLPSFRRRSSYQRFSRSPLLVSRFSLRYPIRL